jgi:hypothetical protein
MSSDKTAAACTGRVLIQPGNTAPVAASIAYTPLHWIWYPLPHFSPHQTSLLLLPVQFFHAAAAVSLGCWLMPDSMGEGRQEKVPAGGEPAARSCSGSTMYSHASQRTGRHNMRQQMVALHTNRLIVHAFIALHLL